MGNFNRRERGDFQKKAWGERDSGNKEQMKYQALCSECGKRCEVPFRPVNGKPVFCNECFAAKRGGGDRLPAKLHYASKGGEGNNDALKREIREMNMKIDRIMRAVESLSGTGPKPVLIEETPKKEEKKAVDAMELKKVLDQATGKEVSKNKAEKKEVKPVSKKPAKKAVVPKKKK